MTELLWPDVLFETEYDVFLTRQLSKNVKFSKFGKISVSVNKELKYELFGKNKESGLKIKFIFLCGLIEFSVELISTDKNMESETLLATLNWFAVKFTNS